VGEEEKEKQVNGYESNLIVQSPNNLHFSILADCLFKLFAIKKTITLSLPLPTCYRKE
jgi:hypothetical protein